MKAEIIFIIQNDRRTMHVATRDVKKHDQVWLTRFQEFETIEKINKKTIYFVSGEFVDSDEDMLKPILRLTPKDLPTLVEGDKVDIEL